MKTHIVRAGLLLALLLSSVVPAYAQDTGPVFLPLVSSGDNSQSAAADDDYIDPKPPENLRDCTEEDYAVTREEAGRPPEYDNWTDGCRLTVIERYEIDGAGTGGDVGREEPSEQVGAAEVNDPFISRKVNSNQLICTTCGNGEGALEFLGTLSAKNPTIPSSANYFYGNFMSAGTDDTITCQNGVTTYKRLTGGVGEGRFSSSLGSTIPKVYYEVFDTNNCYGALTGWFPTEYERPTLQFVRVNHTSTSSLWMMRFWNGSTWIYGPPDMWITTTQTLHFLMAGQEIGSTVSNKHSDVYAKLNWVHNMKVLMSGAFSGQYLPWYNDFLPSYYQGKTNIYRNAPLNLVGPTNVPDYTSVSSLSDQ